MSEPMTVETMEADATTALAIERARGVPVPHGRAFDAMYKLGFCAGSFWAIEKIKEVRDA